MPDLQPQLMPNGDVLAPVNDPQTGEHRMVLVPVGHKNHAGWIAYMQRSNTPKPDQTELAQGVGWAAVISFLLPIIGLLLAITYAVRGRGSAALACILAGFLGIWIYLIVLGFTSV